MSRHEAAVQRNPNATGRRSLAALALLLGAVACGPAAQPSRGPIAPRETASGPVEPPSPRCPEQSGPAVVSRGALRAFLDRGLQSLISRVEVVPVVDGEGPNAGFAGFRIVALAADLRCGPLGIHEGDIVAAVNGTSVERPDDVLALWEDLRDASTVVVSLVRGGRAVDVSVSVVDDPAAGGIEGVGGAGD